MSSKENAISAIMQGMADTLNTVQLDILLNTLTTVLQDFSVESDTTLPSTDVDDTDQLIKRFLAAKKIEGCLTNTLLQYKYTVYRFSLAVNRDLRLVDTNSIRYYLGVMSNGNQNSYVDNLRRYLNSFYQWMEDENIILKNPCRKIKRVKTEKKMEMPFSDEEIALLQDACLTTKEIALVDLLMSTGIRREEVTKIKINEINFDSRSIKIHGKGAKDRLVYFSAKCKLHLLQHINSQKYNTEYLFASNRLPHGQISVETLHSYIKKIGSRACVPNVHLHRFRKWFGTSMADKGVDIRDLKEMMGHEKIDTTNEYYIYANMQRIRSEHQRYAT